MYRVPYHRIALLCGLCALAACSQTPGAPSADSSNKAAAVATATPTTPAPTNNASDSYEDTITQIDCAKIFKPEDATPILGTPAKVSNYTLRDRACDFESSDGSHIQVYGGKGDDLTSTVEWNDATLSSDKDRYARLDGVGDEAYWRKDGLHNSVLSRNGDLWCSANGGMPAKTETDARKLGELCNKVYASGL